MFNVEYCRSFVMQNVCTVRRKSKLRCFDGPIRFPSALVSIIVVLYNKNYLKTATPVGRICEEMILLEKTISRLGFKFWTWLWRKRCLFGTFPDNTGFSTIVLELNKTFKKKTNDTVRVWVLLWYTIVVCFKVRIVVVYDEQRCVYLET